MKSPKDMRMMRSQEERCDAIHSNFFQTIDAISDEQPKVARNILSLVSSDRMVLIFRQINLKPDSINCGGFGVNFPLLIDS